MNPMQLTLLMLSTGWLSDAPRIERGIEYARVGEQVLKLDLYLPPQSKDAPLLVWVHGGAWRSGSREAMPLAKLVAKGWAIASVDYRLSPVAKFPAQIHDIKAAIRFLRARQRQYGYDAEHVVIAGGSAGGHLAALVGVTNEVKELEGDIGNHRDTSSAVQAIVSFYGASNLQTILAQSTPHGLKVRVPALELLLGDLPEEKPELARLGSPVAHVDKHDPPLLLFHGDQDLQMPINQAHELHGAYQRVGRPSEFVVVYGGAHGGPGFFTDAMITHVDAFLRAIGKKGTGSLRPLQKPSK
jgi:acetyl esterase/lipase